MFNNKKPWMTNTYTYAYMVSEDTENHMKYIASEIANAQNIVENKYPGYTIQENPDEEGSTSGLITYVSEDGSRVFVKEILVTGDVVSGITVYAVLDAEDNLVASGTDLNRMREILALHPDTLAKLVSVVVDSTDDPSEVSDNE